MLLSAPITLPPIRQTRQSLLDGVPGTRETMRVMRDAARIAKARPLIHQLARGIISGIPNKAWSREVAAIQEWVRSNIRYTKDPVNVELFTSPEKLIETRQGDCDDHAALVAALLESLGHPCRLVAVAKTPGQFVHVFTETKLGARWVSVETTENVKLGWQPPGMRERLVLHL